MSWIENILALVARFARRLALMRRRPRVAGMSLGQEAVNVYTAALQRLVTIIVVLAVTWGAVALLGRPIPTSIATLVLALFTLFLALAAWPVAFVFFEHEKYQKAAASILATVLGAGVLALVFHVKAAILPELQVAGGYLVVSGYLGPAKGFRRTVNQITGFLIVFLILAPVFPRTAAALSGLVPKADGVGAAVLSGAATKSLTQLATNRSRLITLPSDGSLSATFDVQANVPVGWWYQIDAPVGTQAHWSDGTVTDYHKITLHLGESFRLSNPGGGIATIEWHPVSSGGQ